MSAIFYHLKDWRIAIPALAAAACAGYAAAKFACAPKRSQNVYVLLVKLTLKPGSMPAFLEAFQPLAQHCHEHEGNTLTYVASVSEEDPNTVIIYERYVQKDDLLVTHNSSDAFKAFGKYLSEADIIVSKSKETFWETSVGFASR